MAWLLEQTKLLRSLTNKNPADIANDFVVRGLGNQDPEFLRINPQDMQIGKFYFLLYDLDGPGTKMEQYAPIFLVDHRQIKTEQKIFGICSNFLPGITRMFFFDKLLNAFKDTIENNLKKVPQSQDAFRGLNFEVVYNILKSIGFEYSIREFDLKKINKCYLISTNQIPMFLNINTQWLTGVDDLKLYEIWKVKLKEQEERHKETVQKLVGDWEEVKSTLEEKFGEIEKRMERAKKAQKDLDNLLR